MAKIVEPYVKVKERVRETPTLLNIDGSANIGGVVVSPRGARYQYISGPKDFLEKLVGAEELPRDSHISLINAYYCSYFAGLVIARALNTQAVSAIKLSYSDGAWTTSKVTYLGDTELNATGTLDLTSFDFSSEEGGAFQLNDTIFYHGDEDYLAETVAQSFTDFTVANRVEVNSIQDVLNTINSWSGFSASITNNTIVIQFNVPSGTTFDQILVLSADSDSEVTLAKTKDAVEGSDNYVLFKLTETGSSDRYKISLVPMTTQPTVDGTQQKGVSMLTIQVDDTKSRYEVSINPNDRDQSGNNCYIDNLNASLKGIEIVINGFDSVDWNEVTYPSISDQSFDSDGYNVAESADISSLSSAIYALADQKEYDIEYLSPFGITATAFLKDYCYVGEKNFWFTPVDIPFNYTTAASIDIFAKNIPNSDNVLVAGPFDKNSGFLGWITKIAFSSLYYERVFINRANMSEYAPCFEEVNGVLNYRQPYLKLGEGDRVSLLNGSAGPVDFVVYNQQNNTFYLNDNRCHTTTNNVMSEEMNRRMINKIKKDAVRIMNRFKGRVNTASTRADVNSLLKYYMDANIMNQYYKPVEYQIVCNESNNTTEVITSNGLAVTLRIRLLGSIKFIDVLADIFPLGVDFES